jgi:hypothetical protein
MRSVLLTLMMFACDGDKPIENEDEGSSLPSTDADGGAVDMGCDSDDECSEWQICEEDDCVDGDRNNSFTEAEPISAGDDEGQGISSHINVPGDVDFWRYTSMGSEFIRASVDPHADVPEGAPEPDTFVTLYGPDGTVVTSADDYPNGSRVSNFDSVLYAYLAVAGDYVFVVEDANPMWGAEAWGGEDYTYRLTLDEWGWLTAGDSTFEEPFRMDNDWTDGIQISTNTWNSVGVLLEEEGQVDYLALQFDSENLDGEITTWNDGILFVDGIEDLSGSDAIPLVTVLGPDDLPVASRTGVGPDGPVVAPALRAGEWVLALADADGGGGPNHWFVIMLNADTHDENLDWEDEPNDSTVTANAIEMTENVNGSGKPFSVGSIQGVVDGPGDTDFFSLSAPEESSGENDAGEAAQWLVVCMNSTRWGSAIAPRVTVYGADGSILADQDADSDSGTDPNLTIENVEIEPGEEVIVQVNPGADTEGSPDEWFRLKGFIASFPVSSYEAGGYTCP